MKNLFLSFSQKLPLSRPLILGLLLGLILLGANACKKEWVNDAASGSASNIPIEQRNGNISITDYGVPVSGVTVNNGMLYFSSLNQVNQILDMLDALSADETTNLSILNGLGYSGFDSPGAPERPVLFLFDQYFNFFSLRQKLENLKTQERQTGADFSVERNKMPFWEPGLGSIVNDNGEVRIGELIYKYLDNDRTVVFRAGDPALLNLVRSTPDPFTIQNQFNFFKIDDRKKDDLRLYDRVEAAATFGDCLFDITWSNSGNQFYFHSIGYFPPAGNVVWQIIDGNGNVIATQNGLSVFNYLIPAGVTYPLTVSIKSPGCAPYDVLFAESQQNNNYNCELFDFTYEFDAVNPRKIHFTIPPYTPLVNWNFGDGSVFATPPTGATPYVFSHTYSQDGSYTVCATVMPANCSKTVCKELSNLNCGEKSSFKQEQLFTYGFPSQNKKVEYQFGLKNPLIGKSRVHGKVESWIKINETWQYFQATKIEMMWHSTPGQFYLRYIPDCEIKDEIASSDVWNKAKLEAVRKITKNSKMKIVDARLDYKLTFPSTTLDFDIHL